MSAGDVQKVHSAFPKEDFYVPPVEVMIEKAERRDRGHFDVMHHATGYKADVFLRPNDPLETWAFARRRRVKVEAEEVWVAPPELVIIRKLEFFREGGQRKHIEDIRALMKFEDLDGCFIEMNVKRLGLREQWLACQTGD